ncbi:division/cell wall cluster transcriptional repressor MraZ [Portibacter lacus]|uniref:Transcriptional regulator MraZ n=1 Tax=Portibacter lacus TaxID=1099794 RepID=A0AA37SKW9_9BACT|nr:division/cell wall cluster transcriptional repressor MraZ [Portibacter lacus]GLR15775.1 transcriptional regulator MraZ [Portibacter lacus]
MYTFTGEYEVKVDAKGRVRLPSALLKQIGEGALNFVVNRGFEKHLMMYPSDVWEKKTTEINQLNIYNTKQRQAIRYFYRGATKIATDGAERILLPKSLVEYAGIEKEAVLFAYHEQIEIWSKDAYDEMLNSEPDNFAEIADDIFGEGNSVSDNA